MLNDFLILFPNATSEGWMSSLDWLNSRDNVLENDITSKLEQREEAGVVRVGKEGLPGS
jgi:hypothetical protein